MHWTWIHTILTTLTGTGSIWWVGIKTGLFQWIGEWIGKKWFPERRGEIHHGGNGYLRHTDFENFITTVITRPEFEARVHELRGDIFQIGSKIEANGAQYRTDFKELRKDVFERLDKFIDQVALNQSKKGN